MLPHVLRPLGVERPILKAIGRPLALSQPAAGDRLADVAKPYPIRGKETFWRVNGAAIAVILACRALAEMSFEPALPRIRPQKQGPL